MRLRNAWAASIRGKGWPATRSCPGCPGPSNTRSKAASTFGSLPMWACKMRRASLSTVARGNAAFWPLGRLSPGRLVDLFFPRGSIPDMAQKVSAIVFTPCLPMSGLGVLLLLRVLRGGLGFGGAPTAVAVVTAVVGIPAEHVPKLRPREQFASAQNPRRQLPGPGATRADPLLPSSKRPNAPEGASCGRCAVACCGCGGVAADMRAECWQDNHPLEKRRCRSRAIDGRR